MRRRQFLLLTAAITSLSGCSSDGDTTDPADETETSPVVDSTTSDTENNSGSDPDTETSTTESTSTEPELPSGLQENGIDLDQLRTAVDELVMTGAFRSIAGIDYFDQDEVVSSMSRSVSGISESERGRELEATGGVSLYEKVDESITPEEATIDILLEHNRLHRYLEDGNVYTGPDNPAREYSYDDYLQHVLRYADRVFSMLEAFQYGSPEWDTDLGVFRVPITGIGDEVEWEEGYEVENAEIRVTRDGLPVAAGGRIVPVGDSQEDANMEERLIVLRSDQIDIERPEWVEAGDSEK